MNWQTGIVQVKTWRGQKFVRPDSNLNLCSVSSFAPCVLCHAKSFRKNDKAGKMIHILKIDRLQNQGAEKLLGDRHYDTTLQKAGN
jgi:hypothetical protein